MHVAQIALPLGLHGDHFPEPRRHGAQDVASHGHHERAQDHGDTRAGASVAGETIECESHEADVEQGLRELRVEVGKGRRKSLNVFCQALVSICESRVEIVNTVVSLRAKIQVVRVMNESRPQDKTESGLKKANEAVDEGGWNCQQQPFAELDGEASDVSLHDRLHNTSVKFGHVDGQEGARDEGGGVEE